MTAATILQELRRRGVEVRAIGHRLRDRPREAVTPELLQALRENRDEILGELRRRRLEAGEQSDRLGEFLESSIIPAAVFHSHALGRDFILARDSEALLALTEADQRLPVLFFGEAAALSKLGLEGLRVVLELRETFGPSVVLRAVRKSLQGNSRRFSSDGTDVECENLDDRSGETARAAQIFSRPPRIFLRKRTLISTNPR